MLTNRPQPFVPAPPQGSAVSAIGNEAQALFDSGDVVGAIDLANSGLSRAQSPAEIARLLLIRSVATFETGFATSCIDDLRAAAAMTSGIDHEVEFATTLALFSRESQFLTPPEILPTLGRVRLLAASLGNSNALAGLHLAVARLDAYRGHSLDARRHLEIAKTAAASLKRPAMNASMDLVDASLELVAGNLRRATISARKGYEQSNLHGFGILKAGSLSNLGHLALTRLDLARAKEYLLTAVEQATKLSFIRLGALDSVLQLALHEDDLDQCHLLLDECATLIREQVVPSRSWYDLANQVTRCAVLAHIGDWESVVDLTSELEAEVEARQLTSVRTILLCESAKALAHLGEQGKSQAKLATAIQNCPRGAIDALIVLQAATGSCLALSGDGTRSDSYFERALSAARAIGNKLQEHQILRDRKLCRGNALRGIGSETSPSEQASPKDQRALVLSDVAIILGASSSIDLIAHRSLSLVQGTLLEPRTRMQIFSDQEFRPEMSIESGINASGAFEIQLRGSDRLVLMTFDSIDSLDDVTLVKSLMDLLHAAVYQAGRHTASSNDQDLWPETAAVGDGEAIFRSPRMNEILRVAIRLATTDLPILITGETGTGKDVFARLVHSHSAVKRGAFVPFNCSAIPRDLTESQLFGHRRGAFTGAVDAQPGVIRSAAGGTLFLDEIGDLDLSLQPKLLRFIESGEIHTVGDPRPTKVNVRLIAATNANLEELAQSGHFRKDLLFRLGSARIILPPLRERKDEIPALTTSFINRFSRESGRARLRVSDDLIAALLLYDWPGNIRQLANELHRIVAMAESGQTLTSRDLSPVITEGWTVSPRSGPDAANSMRVSLDQPLPQAIEELERAFVGRAMHASGGRVNEAAQLLGISRKGLFLKRRRWGHLDPEPEGLDE